MFSIANFNCFYFANDVGKNQERVGRGTEKGEGQGGKETTGNQRERGDITVDGFGYSLNVSQYRVRLFLLVPFKCQRNNW